MQIAVFNSKPYDRRFLEEADRNRSCLFTFFEPRLTTETVGLAVGFEAVCVFVNDRLDAAVLERLKAGGTHIVALRCAGFNNVDLAAAARLGLKVVRVPAYSPHAVAEHTVGLILLLNRNLHRAYNRVREGNFSLNGLLGFDLFGKTVGVVGTGQIGACVAQIMQGFGCRVVAFDPFPNAELKSRGVEYVSLEKLLAESDVVTLNCPLTPQTKHLINADTIAKMKPGVMLVNTSRGAVVDTRAVIEGLKSGRIGYLGLDVYEEEANYFFEDHADEGIADDVLARLLTFPNVVVTGHQAFFTNEALTAIAETTLQNIREAADGKPCKNEVRVQQ